jgi:legumain
MIFTDHNDNDIPIDYAPGCRHHMDYMDDQVNAEVMIGVMTGDKDLIYRSTGIENPKMLQSGPEDTVFVYYMDHGNVGFAEVGSKPLREKVLMDTIDKMYENKQYKQMVFYFEACHSGSMFRSLEKGKNVYAMTGSDTEHSAWMSECPPNDIVNGKHIGTCLSAYYDNFWMQKVTDEGAELTHNEMFQHVHEKTAEFTDQNVSQFGDIDTIGEMKVSEFIGNYKPQVHQQTKKEGLVKYEDVPLHLAKWAAIRSDNTNNNDVMNSLKEVVYQEALKDVVVYRLAREYFKDDKAAEAAMNSRPPTYNQSCVRDLGLELVSKCGYSLPMKDTHVSALENICAKGNVNIDFKNVC